MATLALLVGATSWIKINLVGEIYLAQMLLLPAACIVLLVRGDGGLFGLREFKTLCLWGVLMLLGYVVSDLIAGTDSSRFLRGWVRVAVVVLDFVSLATIASSDKRNLWWYYLGSSVATIAIHRIHHISMIGGWKFNYGDPVFMLAGCSAYFLPVIATVGLLIFVGIISIYLDSRAQGAFALLVAMLVWSRSGTAAISLKGSAAKRKAVVISALLVAVLVVAVAQTQATYADRRISSNVGRSTSLLLSAEAVAQSPILGYGSWGQGTERFAKELEDQAQSAGDLAFSADGVMAHSQVMQSWMEGGILAAIFFFVYGFYLIRALRDLLLRRPADYLTALFGCVLVTQLWHAVMSPFTSIHLLGIAGGAAVICCLQLEARPKRVFIRDPVPDAPAAMPLERFPNLLR